MVIRRAPAKAAAWSARLRIGPRAAWVLAMIPVGVALGAALGNLGSPKMIPYGAAAVSGSIGLWYWFRAAWAWSREAAVGGAEEKTIEETVALGAAPLPHLKNGLNQDTAQSIAEIIRRLTGFTAVAITDRQRVLGWSGPGCPRHQANLGLEAIVDPGDDNAPPPRVEVRHDLHWADGDACALRTLVRAPLWVQGQPTGYLCLYADAAGLPRGSLRLAEGTAQLLSILLETAEANREHRLASEARLEALQAQIRPHFLFNVLTIILFSRTDPERSRDLLVQLATFFRRSLSRRGPTIPLSEEIDHVQTYLTLEKARFGDKLRYRIRLDPTVLHAPVPVLILQPLVENAVVHGLAPKEGPGMVSVTTQNRGSYLQIYVTDNGVGIPKDRQAAIFTMGEGTGMGLGLSNVAERLLGLYGPRHALVLRSLPGKGTSVRVRIPLAQPDDRSGPTPP